MHKLTLALVQLTIFGLLLLLPGPNFLNTISPSAKEPLIKGSITQTPLALYPKKKPQEELPPVLSSNSVIVMDVDSAVVLYEKNSKLRIYPASTTKMMTAIVALENYSLDQEVEIPEIDVVPQKINLQKGEKISIENLLYGTLIASGNDAAEALAQVYPLGRAEYVSLMNQKAKELHLLDTHFKNPTGIDEEGHYSTALDLARIASYAIRNTVFSRIVATPKAEIFDTTGRISHQFSNINQLLTSVDGVIGIKTGFTQWAGEALVALAKRDDHEIITVVLGSEDRFGDSKKLIEWAFNNHEWVNLEI